MQQPSEKKVQDWTQQGGDGDPLAIVQKVEIWPNGICTNKNLESDAQTFLGLSETNRSLTSGQKTILRNS